MQLEIRVFAYLRKKISSCITTQTSEAFQLELPDQATVNQLILRLGLESEPSLICLVNGLRQMEDYQLKDGDRVGIFPPVGGG